MKKTFLLSLTLFVSVYFLSWFNSEILFHDWKVRQSFVFEERPLLPDSTTAKVLSFGHMTTVADILWIRLIQHVGNTASTNSFQKSLIDFTELMTDLSPEFTRPYAFALLLAPSHSASGGFSSGFILIGEKGITYTCDSGALTKILMEKNLSSLWQSGSLLRDPCLNGDIPYYLAYRYSIDVGDRAQAKKYYTIASAQTDTPLASRYLIPLMDAKSGLHRVAATILLSLAAETGDISSPSCTYFSRELLGESGSDGLYTQKSEIPDSLLRRLMSIRASIKREISESEEGTQSPISCIDYLDRAIIQIHLEYLEQADARYVQQYGDHASNMEVLFDAGIISTKLLIPGGDNNRTYKYDVASGNWDLMRK